jgi:hypothetical protein
MPKRKLPPPPTAAELAAGEATAAAAAEQIAQERAASPWEVIVIDGGGQGKDQQAAEALEHVLRKLHVNDIRVTFILPNGINRWTVIGQRRLDPITGQPLAIPQPV